jgi:DNA-binding NarL/FixJ family response regulator
MVLLLTGCLPQGEDCEIHLTAIPCRLEFMNGNQNFGATPQIHTGSAQPSKRPNILCVDDHELVRDGIRAMLVRQGWGCQCANDGEDALQWLTSGVKPVDILITDHSMPGMGGLELVEKLRATKFAGKILVHSTRLSGSERAAYLDLDVDAIVPKTGNPEPLIKVIEELRQG